MAGPFFALITNDGADALADALGTATPLQLSYIAVGDGGGSPITPDVTMTALVNERARVNVNAIDVDPATPNKVRVEGLIPVGTGGFTIREAAIFSEDGVMIAIASYPDIYKPTPSEGASVAEYIRIPLEYLSVVDAVELTVDNSTVMATRQYVSDFAFDRFFVSDDFTGSAVDTGKWTTGVTGTGAISVQADTDANGVVKQHSTGGDGTVTQSIPLGLLGTKDFRAQARMKNSAIGSTSSVVRFSVGDISQNAVVFYRGVAFAEWFVQVIQGGIATTDEDAGVVVDTSNYQLFEIRRTSDVFEFLINGAVVWSETVAALNLSSGTPTMKLFSQRGTANTTTVYADMLEIGHPRS
jgi:hypothetical protein